VSPPVPFGPDPIAHRRELADRGVSVGRIRRAIASGRWQEPVPGVVVGHGGPLTQRQRWQVGVRHAGPTGCLSHRSALAVLGARVEELPPARRVAGVVGAYVEPPEGGLVEVSVPHGRHLRSSGFVVVHQSRRPLSVRPVHELPVCSAARAAVDVAITADHRSEVDHVVSHVLQRGMASVEQLAEETRLLGRRATNWLQAAVADACRGMRSVGEADLRRVVVVAGLPEPEWNAEVLTPAGRFFVDALWREHGVGVEADGAAFHLSADDWSQDLVRQNALHAVGIRLLRFPVRRLRAERAACAREIRALVPARSGVAG
jgi:very-short-patch-repair endonuclease